jgi:uncharacterized RDD family membrane protein YckC
MIDIFRFKVVVLVLSLLLLIPAPAAAYIDPNTGNLIYQILFPIITVLVTGFLFLKNAIRRKLSSLKKRLSDKFQDKNQNDQSHRSP